MSNNSSITLESDFDDISSFSSIDSFQPEPFRGELNAGEKRTELSNDPVEIYADDIDMGNTTISKSDTLTSTDLNSKPSSHTLRNTGLSAVEKVVTQNVLQDNVETVESLSQKTVRSPESRGIVDLNRPVTMSNAEFSEEYNIETDTGLVKMKTIETLKRQSSRVSSLKSRPESTRTVKSNKSSKSFTKSITDTSGGSLTAEKLNNAVEKNRKELEKYQRQKSKPQKGIKGLFSKIFD